MRGARVEELRKQLEPLKDERLKLEGEVHRLTFEQAISPTGDGPIGEALREAKEKLEELHTRLGPLQREYNQLSRQFWVSKEDVKANKYDLTASRYRQTEAEGEYFEKPDVTLDRMLILEETIAKEIHELKGML